MIMAIGYNDGNKLGVDHSAYYSTIAIDDEITITHGRTTDQKVQADRLLAMGLGNTLIALETYLTDQKMGILWKEPRTLNLDIQHSLGKCGNSYIHHTNNAVRELNILNDRDLEFKTLMVEMYFRTTKNDLKNQDLRVAIVMRLHKIINSSNYADIRLHVGGCKSDQFNNNKLMAKTMLITNMVQENTLPDNVIRIGDLK